MLERRIILGETNLLIKCDSEEGIEAARQEVAFQRQELKQYIANYPEFLLSLEPIEVEEKAPEIVRKMAEAGKIAGVGPMAAVAGAVAEMAARAAIRAGAKEIIVENGGDIFIISERSVTVGIFAGNSPFSGKIGLKIQPEDMPIAVCASSGTVGHSISFGNADAVVAIAKSAFVADACATAIANKVKDENSIEDALSFASGIKELKGGLIIIDEIFASFGKIPEIVKTESFQLTSGG